MKAIVLLNPLLRYVETLAMPSLIKLIKIKYLLNDAVDYWF